MGDVGSGSLGFLLAFALLIWPRYDSPSALPLLAMPMSAFLLDATLTLARRIVRGEPWWTAHVQHLYQRAARRIGAHWPVTVAYLMWTLLAVCLAVWMLQCTAEWGIITAVVAWYLTGTGVWWVTRQCHYLPTPPEGRAP